MSVQELEAEALKLPANERIRLAQELWDSIVPEAENNPDLLPFEPVRRDTGLSLQARVSRSIRRAGC